MPARGYSVIATPRKPAPAPAPSWGRAEVVAFTANYMVGTGFLTLPHAIVEAGLLLGALSILAAAALAAVASDCLLEAMARACACRDADARGPYGAIATADDDDGGGGETAAPRAPAAAAAGGGRGWVVGSERIDVPELCAYFLGRRGQLVYVASICLYIYSSLWA